MSGSPDKHEHDEEPLAEGTLVSHLLELRSRIMKALGAVLLVFVETRRAPAKHALHRSVADDAAPPPTMPKDALAISADVPRVPLLLRSNACYRQPR
jgi:hypothetical protein